MINFQNRVAATRNNEINIKQYLSRHQWPDGLQDTLIASLNRIPVRFFILDDSSSMNACDGKKFLSLSRTFPVQATTLKDAVLEWFYDIVQKVMPVSTLMQTDGLMRWEELEDCVIFHAELSKVSFDLNHPHFTCFAFLNDPPGRLHDYQIGGVGSSRAKNYTNLTSLKARLNQEKTVLSLNKSTKKSPLCKKLKEVAIAIKIWRENIRMQDPYDNYPISVTLLTDGEPDGDDGSKDDLYEVMRSLENDNVIINVRLCTNEDKILEFYNDIDKRLTLSSNITIDVLDDLESEEKQGNTYLLGNLYLKSCFK